MLRLTFTTYLFIFFVNQCLAQNYKTDLSVGQRAGLLVEVLNRNHCEPQTIDNAFSKKLFNAFVDNIDPEKNILTQEDILAIRNNEQLLDDQIKAKNLTLIPKVGQLLQRRLQKIDSLVGNITSKAINFQSKFTYVTVYDSLAKNESELKIRLQRELKYRIFQNLYYSLLDTHSLSLSPDYLNYSKMIELEKSAREQARDRFKSKISNSLEISSQDFTTKLETLFLQTLAQVYDIHTEYFDTEAATEFMQSFSPENEVFGFSLDENKRGEIIIADLLPGGPAWESGLLNEGDLLLNFTFEGKKTVNAVGADIFELEETIHNEKAKNISLTVRKASKEIQTLKLTKQIVLSENEAVRGLILENKDKFGYINLPAFYSDYESEEQLGCANDIAKELIKMKEDNIKGLILDLRFNGGGSVGEALDLAGIFIDQGVFGAAKPAKGKSILLKDPNRGSIYDGPLVVLVNQASASASEILVGILKDYNRAVIAGSNTFGKGVAQGILPLDSLSKEPKYYTKATIWRAFSPSGKALQHNGVSPDITLPSIFDGGNIAEKAEKFSLLPTVLDRTLLFTPESPLPIANLAQKSKRRIDANKSFEIIGKMAEILNESAKNEKIPEEFTWESFCKYQVELEKIFEAFNKKTEVKNAKFKVNVPSHDRERARIDQFWNKLNEKLFEQISKDIYIEESLEILINLNE